MNGHLIPFKGKCMGVVVKTNTQGSTVGIGVVRIGPRDNGRVDVSGACISERLGHEDTFTSFEQGTFLSSQMPTPFKIAQMRLAQMSEHPLVWMDARLKPFHFTRLTDACLNNGHVVMRLHGPNTQRHAKLTVVAQWTSMDGPFGREQARKPLLHSGFSIASSDSNDRPFEGISFCAGHALESEQDIGHDDDVRIQAPWLLRAGRFTHHKPPNTLRVGVSNERMTIVPGPTHGKKDSGLWVKQRSGIRTLVQDVAFVRTTQQTRTTLL